MILFARWTGEGMVPVDELPNCQSLLHKDDGTAISRFGARRLGLPGRFLDRIPFVLALGCSFVVEKHFEPLEI